MSRKFIDETAKSFRPDGDFDKCEEDKGWLPFLLAKAADEKIELEIRDARGWPQTPRRTPFQLEIPTDDDEVFCSYVVAFFGTEKQARRWVEKTGLTVKPGLAKI
jgi:hypothetical protein